MFNGLEPKVELKEWNLMDDVDQQKNNFKGCSKKLKLEVKPIADKQEVEEEMMVLETFNGFKKETEEFITISSLEKFTKKPGPKDVKQEINAVSNIFDEGVEEFIHQDKIEKDEYPLQLKYEIFSNRCDEPKKLSDTFSELVHSTKNIEFVSDKKIVNIPPNEKSSFICNICEKNFSAQRSLKLHMNIHKEIKPHSCEICGRSFAQKPHLTRHMRTHTGERPFKCSYCPATFADIFTVRNHYSTHTNERSHSCDICGLTFVKKATLARHMKTHTGERPYKCSYCEKAFADITSRHKHHRTHTDERPYACDICAKSFAIKFDLKRHKVEVHNVVETDNNISPKTYNCEICERIFIYKSDFTRHMRKHTGERPYKCSYCPKSFADSGTRRIHHLTHTNERPHNCDICGLTFVQKGNLARHIRTTHTSERP